MWCSQIMGFGFVFAIFLICGVAFTQLTASPARLKWFQVDSLFLAHSVLFQPYTRHLPVRRDGISVERNPVSTVHP